MDNLIDIGQTRELPLDEARLEAIRRRARETARARSWDALVARVADRRPGLDRSGVD